MKAVLCIFLTFVACVLLDIAKGGECDMSYTNLDLRCGFNGNCYKEFPNECAIDIENLKAKKKFKTVTMKLCEEAQMEGYDDLKYCS